MEQIGLFTTTMKCFPVEGPVKGLLPLPQKSPLAMPKKQTFRQPLSPWP